MDNPKKINNFSEDEGNMEIVSATPKADPPSRVDNDGLDIDVSNGGRIIIGRLNILAPLKDRHEKFYKESKFHLIADIVLAFIIIVLGISLVWITFFKSEKNIYLESKSLGGAIMSGRPEIIEVAYGNRNGEEIEESSITVKLPDGFDLAGTEPANIFDENTGTFRIGNLGQGANGKVRLKGTAIGAIGDREVMAFVFNFKKNGKLMSVLNSFAYKIEGSVLEAGLSLPKKVYQGSEFEGTINLKNNGETDISGIRLSVKGNEWELRGGQDAFPPVAVKAGEAVKIGFTALPAGTKETADFIVEIFLDKDSRHLLQASARKALAVNIPKFKVEIGTELGCMKPEDQVSYRIKYQNDETSPITKIRLAMASANPNFEISRVSLPADAGFRQDGLVLSLNDLEPGKTGEASFKLDMVRKKYGTNDQAVISLGIDYEIGGEKIAYKIQSEPLKSLSNLHVKSAAYYYSLQGDQLGIGPLPPAVDIPTRYWVFWELANVGNDLKDLSFSAQLPEDVTLTDNKSLLAGNLQYGQIGRKIIWVVDKISMDGGNYKAGFEVEVVPKKTDIGHAKILLSDIKYSVNDTFCQEDIKANLPDITTSLSADRLASGKGKIVE